MKLKMIFTIFLQLVCVAILLPAAYGKLVSQPGAIFVFTTLDMEPAGRYIIGLIGLIELLCSLLLMTKNYSASGALLAFGTMLGALFAHLGKLGIVVNGDGGQIFGMMLVVLITSFFILISRYRQLPFITPHST